MTMSLSGMSIDRLKRIIDNISNTMESKFGKDHFFDDFLKYIDGQIKYEKGDWFRFGFDPNKKPYKFNIIVGTRFEKKYINYAIVHCYFHAYFNIRKDYSLEYDPISFNCGNNDEIDNEADLFCYLFYKKCLESKIDFKIPDKVIGKYENGKY